MQYLIVCPNRNRIFHHFDGSARSCSKFTRFSGMLSAAWAAGCLVHFSNLEAYKSELRNSNLRPQTNFLHPLMYVCIYIKNINIY